MAHFKAGRYEEGARDFQAALDIDSGSPHDLANLGLCHKFMGNRAEAMDYLRAALDMDPGLDYAREHLNELEPILDRCAKMPEAIFVGRKCVTRLTKAWRWK